MQEIYETARTIFPFSQEEREILLHFNRNGNSKLEDVEVRNKL